MLVTQKIKTKFARWFRSRLSQALTVWYNDLYTRLSALLISVGKLTITIITIHKSNRIGATSNQRIPKLPNVVGYLCWQVSPLTTRI